MFIRSLLSAAIVAASVSCASAADISGAGATSRIPIYAKWADTYKKETGNGLNYQSIGSGGGIKQIKAKTVTFGATDTPLKPKDSTSRRPRAIPDGDGRRSCRSSISTASEPSELVLDGPTLANIFLGKITKWDDPAIAKLNPSVKLPSQRDRRRASLRRLGHDLQLHRLSVQGQPGLEVQGRRQHRGRMAGRHRRQGQRRRLQQRRPDQGLDRLRRIRLRAAEQDGVGRHDQQGRQDASTPTAAAFQAAAANADWAKSDRLLRHPDQPAGREVLADRRRDLHPDVSAAERRRGRRPRPSSSSTGPTPTAPRWPRNSTTCRCRPRSIAQIEKTWADDIKTAGRQAGVRRQVSLGATDRPGRSRTPRLQLQAQRFAPRCTGVRSEVLEND